MPSGTALALLIGPWVMGAGGWSFWWWGLALWTVAMALWVARCVPADPRRSPAAASNGWAIRLRQTLGSRGPWLVALAFAVYSSQWLAVIGFLPSIYAQAGLAGPVAGALTALASAANIVGNVGAGRVLWRGWPAPRLLAIGYLTMAAGALIAFGLPIGQGPGAAGLRYAAVLAFSAAGGLIPGALFSLAVKLAPSEQTVSTTVGWVQQCSSIGQFVGPPLVAWVAAAVGGWHWTWAVTGSCSLLGLGLAGAIAGQLRRPPVG
jgi:cyanate permease